MTPPSGGVFYREISQNKHRCASVHASSPIFMFHSRTAGQKEDIGLTHEALMSLQADIRRDEKRSGEEPYDMAETVGRDAESIKAQLDEDSGLF